MQPDVAKRLGIHKGSVQNWERDIGESGIRVLPKVIEYLGYHPEPEPTNLPHRTAYARRRLGFTQQDSAHALELNPLTVYGLEKRQSEPPSAKLRKLQDMLGDRFAIIPR